MLLCFKIIEESATDVVYENEKVSSSSSVGRPRSLTKFEEFTFGINETKTAIT